MSAQLYNKVQHISDRVELLEQRALETLQPPAYAVSEGMARLESRVKRLEGELMALKARMGKQKEAA